MSVINLTSSFARQAQHPMWRQFFLGDGLDDGLHSMQIRSSSIDLSFVFLKFSFHHAIFILQNSSGNVHEVQYLDEDGALRSIVSLTEHWPPVVNMPNHDAP